MSGSKCQSSNHSNHLCMLEQQGKNDEIKKITKTREYICSYCRRAADKPEYLCSPQKA